MSLIGKQITNYRLVELINRGGYGSVFRAEHLFLPGHIAAVKLLNVLYGESEKERARFLQEARLLYQLKHPHILTIYDTGIDDDLGVPYIVFDYAPGRSLRDRLKRLEGRLLSPGEILRVLMQIGQALEYAHQQNVIHLDLKPENILFNERGDALLSDFGIASVVEASIRQTGGIRGTVAYMSPEQLRGIESREADQYALGSLAYELCTGRRAFENSSLAQVAKHTGEAPTPPRHYNPFLPAHVERAILRAMAQERTDRYPNISAFLYALNQAPVEEQSLPPTLPSLTPSQSVPPTMPAQPQTPPAPAASPEPPNRPRQEMATPAAHTPDTAQEQYNQGNKFYQTKLYDKALIAFNKAAHLEPRNARYQSARGRALTSLKFHEQAGQAFEIAAKLEPKVHDHLKGLGEALYELKEYEKAWQIFKKAAQLAPKIAYYYRMQGESLYKLGRFEEALDAFQASAQLDHKGGINPHMQGEVLCALGRFEEALQAFAKAAKLEPGNANHRKRQEQIRDQLKAQEPQAPPAQPQNAKSSPPAAEKPKQPQSVPKTPAAPPQSAKSPAPAAKPKQPSPAPQASPTQSAKSPAPTAKPEQSQDPLLTGTVHQIYHRGESLFKKKDYQRALIAYNEAVKLEPGNANYQCGRGRALYALTFYGEALAAFNEAIRQNSHHSEGYFKKAEVLQAMGRTQEARQTLEQARKVESANQKKKASKSNTAQNSPGKSTTPQNTSGKNAPAQNTTGQNSPGKSAASQDTSGKNAPAQNASSKNGSAPNNAGKNGSVQNATSKNSGTQKKNSKNRTAQNTSSKNSGTQKKNGKSDPAQSQEGLLQKFWRNLLG